MFKRVTTSKIINKVLPYAKALRWLLRNSPRPDSAILFVVGSGRSGTSLIQQVFERDFDTQVFDEFSRLSSDDKRERLRLNRLTSVQDEIAGSRARLVVLKPLVESQNTPRLLQHFPGSKAVWMFRSYSDVASSFAKAWSHDQNIRNLRPIVENDADNWRSEGISEITRGIVARNFSTDMSSTDAAALFWVARNRLFFERRLNEDMHVSMCKYADLVESPAQVIEAMYEFAGVPFPSERITRIVNRKSVGKGSSVRLRPSIEALCEDMWNDLLKAYETRGVLVRGIEQ